MRINARTRALLIECLEHCEGFLGPMAWRDLRADLDDLEDYEAQGLEPVEVAGLEADCEKYHKALKDAWYLVGRLKTVPTPEQWSELQDILREALVS